MTTANPQSASSKRRRLDDRNRTQTSQKGKKDIKKLIDTDYYDPDQDPEQRRATKRNLRSLLSTLRDSKPEYLQPGSQGLISTLNEADELFKDVKQTSDAVIDSRLLVDVADASYKKVRTMTVGDTSLGIDVDDFVNKCILFMKKGTSSGQQGSTQIQRRRRQQAEDDDDDGDNGDAMNWAHLGRNACFLSNSRPCLSGFLLGPLSVQKKVRQQTQRRAREARADDAQALRPIQSQGPDKEDATSLTQICTEISKLLERTSREGAEAADAEYNELEKELERELSQQEVNALMRRHHLSDNGFVPFYDFCVNPESFGQTIENIFYVSFLVKEGRAGILFDKDGLPTIGQPEETGVKEKHEAGYQRNQCIISLDHVEWEEIVESFGIKESIIPHRNEDEVYDDGVIDTRRLRSPSLGNARSQTVDRSGQQEDEDSDMYG